MECHYCEHFKQIQGKSARRKKEAFGKKVKKRKNSDDFINERYCKQINQWVTADDDLDCPYFLLTSSFFCWKFNYYVYTFACVSWRQKCEYAYIQSNCRKCRVKDEIIQQLRGKSWLYRILKDPRAYKNYCETGELPQRKKLVKREKEAA